MTKEFFCVLEERAFKWLQKYVGNKFYLRMTAEIAHGKGKPEVDWLSSFTFWKQKDLANAILLCACAFTFTLSFHCSSGTTFVPSHFPFIFIPFSYIYEYCVIMEITYLEWCYHQDKRIWMPKEKTGGRVQYSSNSRGILCRNIWIQIMIRLHSICVTGGEFINFFEFSI